MSKNHVRIGSSLEDFLKEEKIFKKADKASNISMSSIAFRILDKLIVKNKISFKSDKGPMCMSNMCNYKGKLQVEFDHCCNHTPKRKKKK